jgi:hypothetical protein
MTYRSLKPLELPVNLTLGVGVALFVLGELDNRLRPAAVLELGEISDGLDSKIGEQLLRFFRQSLQDMKRRRDHVSERLGLCCTDNAIVNVHDASRQAAILCFHLGKSLDATSDEKVLVFRQLSDSPDAQVLENPRVKITDSLKGQNIGFRNIGQMLTLILLHQGLGAIELVVLPSSELGFLSGWRFLIRHGCFLACLVVMGGVACLRFGSHLCCLNCEPQTGTNDFDISKGIRRRISKKRSQLTRMIRMYLVDVIWEPGLFD